jgi:hypothetical protein
MPAQITGVSAGQISISDPSYDPASILTLLTQQSGASPSLGNQIYPDTTGLPEFSWKILAGAYVGTYYINRNNPQGLSYWTQAYTVGPIGFNQFYNYRHWTDEHTYDGNVINNSPFDLLVELVIDDAASGAYTYFNPTLFLGNTNTSINGGPVTYYYQHFSPNADFTHTINLNPPVSGVFLTALQITDLDTGFVIADFLSGSPPIFLNAATWVGFSCTLPFFRRYYITIDVT